MIISLAYVYMQPEEFCNLAYILVSTVIEIDKYKNIAGSTEKYVKNKFLKKSHILVQILY